METRRAGLAPDLATRAYIGGVALAGLLVLVVVIAARWGVMTQHGYAVIAMLFALTVVSELFPVQVSFRYESKDVTLSTTFVFATMLVAGPAAAIVAQALACLVSDLIARKAWWKIAFNVGQYTLAWAAAGVVLGLGRFHVGVPVSIDDIPTLMLAGLAFFVVNLGLIGVAISRTLGAPLVPFLRRDLPFQFSTASVLLSLSPVVAVVAEVSPALVPVLIVPIAAVYRSARVSIEKEHQAHHDALTGLPNRVLFHERIEHAIVEQPDACAAVFIVDLDSFKEVNDTLGHDTGDQLLRELGCRLQRAFTDTAATVARLGGDEFAVFVPVDDLDDVGRRATSIHDALSAPLLLGGLAVTVGGSVGAAIYPEHGGEVGTLLRRADVAMYLAKDAGTGFEAYSIERDNHTTRRLALLGELRDAIENGHLVLHFQPVAELATGRLVASEALVRWQHPVHGLVYPDEFIPMAEPTGLIEPLTAYVIEHALTACRAWHDAGHEIRVAVNVSVRNLYEASFAECVETMLQQTGLAPGVLELEITESTLMADPGRANRILTTLHDMGVSLALDDFGTGYSSLAYLKRLPVDRVKIDRSFVSNMEHDENDAAIVRSIIDLARNLGLEVIAEGVETEQQWSLLAELGCDLAQGYYLGRPGPLDRLFGTRSVISARADELAS